jgi:PAS domain S-box-containing protein
MAARHEDDADEINRLQHCIDDLTNELDRRVAQLTAELAAAQEDLRKEAVERTRVEAALQQSQAQIADGKRDVRLTIDTIPVFVATYRPDGTRTFVNRTWQEYMGLTLEEATRSGAKIFPHFHPADAQRNDEAWRASLESGEPLSIEVRVRRSDGQYRWHTSRRAPLRDEKGDIVEWYSVGIDIQDQKAAEDALRQSQERLAETERELRKIVDTIPAFAWSARTDGTAEFLSQHYLDYVGLCLDQAQGWGWTAAVHPDDLHALTGIWKATLASGQPGEAEARLRRHDGEYRWFLFRVNPLCDDGGNVIKWYGTNIDIEDRKRAEEALRREVIERTRAEQLARIEETRFRRFFDLPLIGMGVTSPERRFLEVNEKLCQILGYSREEMIGRDWASITHQDDLPGNLGLLDAAMAGASESYSMDKRYIHRDGQVVYVSISVCCVRRADGTADHFVLTVQDVTARKLAQQEIVRVKDLYAALSETNRAIIHIHEPEALFQEVCRVAVEFGHFSLVWAGLLNEQTGWVESIAPQGPASAGFPAVRVSIDPALPEGRGFSGDALREGRLYVVNDYYAHPRGVPWAAQSRAAGVKSMVTLPLKRHGRCVGVMNVYADEVGYFTDDLVRLLEEIAMSVSFGLEYMERDALRAQAEDELRRSEARFRSLTELSSDWYWKEDENMRFTYLSRRVEEMTGYSRDSFIGKTRWELENMTPVSTSWPEHKAVVEARRPFRDLELRRIGQDGVVRYLSVSGAPVFDEQGLFKG